MQAARCATRLQRELRMLQTDPPPGVCAWPCNESIYDLEAQIQGPNATVYENGVFKLKVQMTERYPFEPPHVRFITPIYHPNIDSGGRICLDILNMPPKGAWRPCLNIPTVLASITLLLAEPNADDGLMGDITAEYKHNRSSFDLKARRWTEKHAVQISSQERDNSCEALDDISTQRLASVCATSPAPAAICSGADTSRQSEPVTEFRVTDALPTKPKMNLSMKLSLDKGLKVLDRDSSASKGTPMKSALVATDNKFTPSCIGLDPVSLTSGSSREPDVPKEGKYSSLLCSKSLKLSRQRDLPTSEGLSHRSGSRTSGLRNEIKGMDVECVVLDSESDDDTMEKSRRLPLVQRQVAKRRAFDRSNALQM